MNSVLGGDALTRGGPHVGDVEILRAVIVVIEPGNAHAGADVFNPSLGGNIGEGSVTVVAVKILAAEIVHNV